MKFDTEFARVLLAYVLTEFCVPRPQHDGPLTPFLASTAGRSALLCAALAAAVAVGTPVQWHRMTIWGLLLGLWLAHLLLHVLATIYHRDASPNLALIAMPYTVVVIAFTVLVTGRFEPISNSWHQTRSFLQDNKLVTIALVYAVSAAPAGYLISLFTSRWAKQHNARGLLSAGKWIGILERLFIISFLLAKQPAAIAALLAAKGVMRFGEIKQADKGSREQAEYILIGTMLSYFVAFLLGTWLVLCLGPQYTIFDLKTLTKSP